MSLAKEINEKLDEIILLKAGIEEMKRDLSADSRLENLETGDEMSRDDALKCAEGVIDRVSEDLNKITNNGQNVRNIFDNPYYINDTIQDKMIAEQNAKLI